MTPTEKFLAAVAADTTEYVGPRLLAYPGGTITLAAEVPVSLDEINESGKNGHTWTERGRDYGTCAVCHLERPVAVMVQVGGRYYCPDEAPKEK